MFMSCLSFIYFIILRLTSRSTRTDTLFPCTTPFRSGDGDLAVLGPADRGHELDALDARQGILELLGDLGVHDLGAGAEIGGLHGHHRLVDVDRKSTRLNSRH